MKVKKYVAPTMPEAMKLIREELGNDAVILNSKMVTSGGFMGFFKKQNIEVIAAVDQMQTADKLARNEIPKVKQKPSMQPKPKQTMPEQPKPAISTSIPSNLEVKKPQSAMVGEKLSEEKMLKEMAELRKTLQQITNAGSQIPLPEPIQLWNQRLIEQELEKGMRDELIAFALQKWYETGAKADALDVQEWLREALIDELADLSFGGIKFHKKFVNLVGPTGVGKTTTLAKIAAECSLKYKKKVALITTDTYRIAAIDQLKTYAKILNVPIAVCYNMEDYNQACESFKEYDIVLIDTAGRNFRNRQYVEDLKKVVSYDQGMETFLVLALTAKQKDMEEIYSQFSLINIDKFIFTKADETSTYGSMLHMIKSNRIGVAYITNGQNVPDDMISANREKITNLILGVE